VLRVALPSWGNVMMCNPQLIFFGRDIEMKLSVYASKDQRVRLVAPSSRDVTANRQIKACLWVAQECCISGIAVICNRFDLSQCQGLVPLVIEMERFKGWMSIMIFMSNPKRYTFSTWTPHSRLPTKSADAHEFEIASLHEI